MTEKKFNEMAFNLIFEYSVFNEFGNTDIMMNHNLTEEEKEKSKKILNNIENFINYQKQRNEKFIQHSKNDEIKA